MRFVSRKLCGIMLYVLTLIALPQAANAKPVEQEPSTITVYGLVEHSTTLSMESLRKMHVVEKVHTPIVCDSGETKKELKSFKGILLRDILDSVKVSIENPRQRGEYYILVRASDDYNVIFSYNELYYGADGDATWLIFEENGQPIDKDGPFVVLCDNDRRNGPRHVKWVQSIEVAKITTEK